MTADIGVDLEPRYGGRRGWPLPELQQRMGVPGVALAVVDGGDIAGTYLSGVRRFGSHGPIREDTLFQAGSISKPVAAMVALRLVAEGTFALDDEANQLLTSWNIPPEDGWQPTVTVRQLLSHTGGLTVHWFPGYPRDIRPPTVPDILDGRRNANTVPVRVRSVPGAQHSYSGGGYLVLQQLLTDVTGVAFPELARRLVFEPAEMSYSTYEQPLPEDLWPRAASGHRTAGRPVGGEWHVYPEMAAAGLWTTAADLARFLLAIQRAYERRQGALLPPALIEEMLTPQASNVPYGLGLMVAGDAHRRFSHGGDDQGFQAAMVGYFSGGIGAAVMSNGDVGSLVLPGIINAIAREYAWPEFPGSEDRTPSTPRRDLQKLAGTYVAADLRLKIDVDGNRLVLAYPGQRPIGLSPRTDEHWFATSINLDLEFRSVGGTASGLILRQEARYTTPVEALREAD